MGAKHFLRGATFGALLASFLTLLLAPSAGKKTRKDAVKLINALAKQISLKAVQMKKLSKSGYEELVTQTIADYAKGKNVAVSSYKDIADILKKNWDEIKNVLQKK